MYDANSIEECDCQCKAPWGGAACDKLELKALPMPPIIAIMLATALTAVLGYLIFSTNLPSTEPNTFNSLMRMEAVDSLLDAVAFGITWLQDGFHFVNDPHYLYAWTVGLLAMGSAVFFLVEFRLLRDWAFPKSVIVVHILLEDGLQLMLYTIASLSSFSGTAGLSMGIVLAILQGLFFFVTKMNDVFKEGGPREPKLLSRTEYQSDSKAFHVIDNDRKEEREIKRSAAGDEGPISQSQIAAFMNKVGSSLDQVKATTRLEWHSKSLTASDCKVIAYLAASGALPKLEELSLFSNSIGDVGMSALADALGKGALASLRELALGRNAIGDVGLQSLAHAITPVSEGGSGALPALQILFIDSPSAELTAYCASKSIKLNTY